LLLVDCQTTGASAGRSSLLELGWTIASAEDSEIKVKSFLVKQPVDAPLSRQIMRLTGITAGDMEAARESAAIFQDFDQDLRLLQAPGHVALAHYAQFEETFLRRLYESQQEQFPLSFICTCQIAKRLFPDLPSRSLRAVAGYFGFNWEEEKRASSHVALTHFVWVNLVRVLGELELISTDDFEKWWRSGESRARSASPLLPMERLKRLSLQDASGVYKMLGASGAVLYVGKATSLKNRVNSYFRGRKGKNSRLKELVSQIFDVEVEQTATSLEAALREQDLIKAHNPPYNRALKEYDRQVEFAACDFLSFSQAQNREFSRGPFPANTVQPFIDLFKALQGGVFAAGLLREPVAQSTVNEALEQMREQLSAELGADYTSRSLLTHVLCRVRADFNEQSRLIRQFWLLVPEKRRAFAQEHFLVEEDAEPELEEEEVPEVSALSVDDVLRRFYGIIFRLARALFIAGQLTKLLNATIEFVDLAGVGGKARTVEGRQLQFQVGVLAVSESLGRRSASGLRPARISRLAAEPYAWSGFGRESLVIFDRMRVLQAELARGNRLVINRVVLG
jgi:DNA polymerase-3 subunit epsilon